MDNTILVVGMTLMLTRQNFTGEPDAAMSCLSGSVDAGWRRTSAMRQRATLRPCLHELDKYMERYTNLSPAQRRRRRLKGFANYIYARYCDDFVVLCNGTKKQAEEMKEELRIFLKDELGIELSTEKTKVTHLNDGFQFLGFKIWRCRTQKGINTIVTIPKEAMDNIREKIKRATDPTTHSDSVYTKILALNRIIGGWCRYYQYTGKATRQFSEIDYYLFWKMAHWLGRKFSLSIPEVMKRYMRNNTFVYEGCWLKRPSDYKTRRYRSNPFKPNPFTTMEYRIEWKTDEYPQAVAWTGRESRPGWADLRQSVIKRDDHTCQMCKKTVTTKTAQVDHIKGYRYFKLPVNANVMDNLQTLCIECHELKTQAIANQ